MSDDEEMEPKSNLEPEEDQDEEILLRVLSREHSKPIMEVILDARKFDTNVVLGWISNMEKLFEFGGTPNNSKVKIAITRLKGHA